MAFFQRMIGRLRQSRLVQSGMVRLFSFYVWLVLRTTRWTVEGQEHIDRLTNGDAGFIIVIWHGRLFFAPTWPPKGRRTVAMISRSRDGEMISAVVARWGVISVRGSTYDKEKRRSKGGADAYMQAMREIRDNRAVVAITPDGPRGPRMHAQAGAAQLAAETGSETISITFSTVRGKNLRSWDSFLLPRPFGRGVLIYGEPIPAPDPSPEAVEAHKKALERLLTETTQRADLLGGRVPVEPAEPGRR